MLLLPGLLLWRGVSDRVDVAEILLGLDKAAVSLAVVNPDTTDISGAEE